MRKEKYIKQAGVLFDEEFYELLIKVTDKKEISRSEFIRKIVERELKKEVLNDE